MKPPISSIVLLFKQAPSSYVLLSKQPASSFLLLFKQPASSFLLLFKHPASSFVLLFKHPASSFVLLFKQAFLFLALLLLLVSCEKPITSSENNEAPQNGNLVVSVPTDGLTSTRLNFAVYDTSGTRVKQVNQQSGSADFGVANFQLAPGDYLLVVVAHSSDGNPTMSDPKKIQFKNSQGFTDTFLYCDTITVDDSRKEPQVVPKRIVSLCRFVIKDEYPADVKKMRFYYTGGSGAFDATTGLGCVNSKQSLMFDVTSVQKQFDLYTFLHQKEGTIHLAVTAYDAGDNVLYEREFDVPMAQNRMTWLAGSFFTGGTMTTSTISVNTEWDEEAHLTF